MSQKASQEYDSLSRDERKFKNALAKVADDSFFEALGPDLALQFKRAAFFLYCQGKIDALGIVMEDIQSATTEAVPAGQSQAES